MFKEIKDKIENFIRELETFKKDQMEILELKNKITAIITQWWVLQQIRNL